MRLVGIAGFLLFRLFCRPVLCASLIFERIGARFRGLPPVVDGDLNVILVTSLHRNSINELLVFRLGSGSALVHLRGGICSSVEDNVLRLRVFTGRNRSNRCRNLVIALVVISGHV